MRPVSCGRFIGQLHRFADGKSDRETGAAIFPVLRDHLTTVRFDPEALGAAAFELLYARLQGKRPKNRVMPSELVIRGSTAG